MHKPEEAGPGARHGAAAGTPSERGGVARGHEFGRPQQVGHFAQADAREPELSGEVLREVTPFSDMFPFNARGCPSVFLHRMNQAGTRYFHHSHLDDLQSVSSEVIATHANAAAHLAHLTAFTAPPFARAIPAAQMAEVREMAERYFG